MQVISLQTPISQLVISYPEIKAILYDLGFEDIIKPGMLQTVGRFMTLEKGSKMKHIAIESIKTAFEAQGFEISE